MNKCKQLMNLFKIRHVTTTAWHPQGNSITERFNQTLINMLTPFVNDPKEVAEWTSYLCALVATYNATPHTVTKISPYYALFGRQAATVLDRWVITNIDPKEPINLNNYIVQLQEALFFAQKHCSERAYEASLVATNMDITPTPFSSFQVGDLVWKFRGKHKLAKPWEGPCRVLVKRTPITYLITPVHGQGRTICHVSNLKLCKLRSDNEVIVESDERPIRTEASYQTSTTLLEYPIVEQDIEEEDSADEPVTSSFPEVSPSQIEKDTSSSTTPVQVVRLDKPKIERRYNLRSNPKQVDPGFFITNPNTLEVAEHLLGAVHAVNQNQSSVTLSS